MRTLALTSRPGPRLRGKRSPNNSEQRSQQLVLVQNLRQLIKERRQSLRVRFFSNCPAQFTHTDNKVGFHISPEWRVI